MLPSNAGGSANIMPRKVPRASSSLPTWMLQESKPPASSSGALPSIPLYPGSSTSSLSLSLPNSAAGKAKCPTSHVTERKRRKDFLDDYVRKLHAVWVYPAGSQELVSPTFHRVRALLEITSLNQAFICDRTTIDSSALVEYLGCCYKGRKQHMEEKLEVFVTDYLEGKYDDFLLKPWCKIAPRPANITIQAACVPVSLPIPMPLPIPQFNANVPSAYLNRSVPQPPNYIQPLPPPPATSTTDATAAAATATTISEIDKAEQRKIRNRLSAAKSNERRRIKLDTQKKELEILHAKVAELTIIKQQMAEENGRLKAQIHVKPQPATDPSPAGKQASAP